MDGIGNQLLQVRERERLQHNLIDQRVALADLVQRAHQRVRRTDLVVAVGAEQEQVARLRVGHQIGDQREAGRVEPLQVVQKQRQRVLRPGKDADELLEDPVKAALRVGRRQLQRPAAAGR